MKVTTVRFGEDLWSMLEAEASADGTSVSQYIREAALARAVASAATRGGDPFAQMATDDVPARSEIRKAADARAQTREAREDAEALRAESRQAKSRYADRNGRDGTR